MAMATDEEASKPSSLPSYSEMIIAAIETLDDKNGSDRTAIANYIESKYAELVTEAHPSLLTAHLERMKESGEIVMVKDTGCYRKAGPDDALQTTSPLKRGRGRPPKAKPAGSVETTSPPASPRPRGRPPKPKDPLAAAVAKAASGLPRPRGRPPKRTKTEGEAAAAAAAVPGVKRGRGRPPKVKMPFADVGFA